MKELLDAIEALETLKKEVEKRCRAYVADTSKPLEERWDLFCKAPNKEHKGWYDDMGGKMDSAYDDLGLDRHAVFNVCDWVNDNQKQLNKDKKGYACDFVKKLGQKGLAEIKEHYMKNYIGSWENDW